MYEVIFYKNRSGNESIKEYLYSLKSKSDSCKDDRIKLEKIMTYIGALERYGVRIGSPMVKHLEGDIWELRPLRIRILLFLWQDNIFVLLHHFVKKTSKTPRKEIEQAKRNRNDFLERNH